MYVGLLCILPVRNKQIFKPIKHIYISVIGYFALTYWNSCQHSHGFPGTEDNIHIYTGQECAQNLGICLYSYAG